MAKLNKLKNTVDAWLVNRMQALTEAQDAYFAVHGRYFQGLWSHKENLKHTDAKADTKTPDNLSSHPHDQTATWHDFIGNKFNALKFPGQLALDVFEGPDGHWWEARMQMDHGADTYLNNGQRGWTKKPNKKRKT